MAIDLSKVGFREGLKARKRPYWQRLEPGVYLGYRASMKQGPGTWLYRVYIREEGKYVEKAIPALPSLPAAEMYKAAKDKAQEEAKRLADGGVVNVEIVTVEDACRDYAKTRQEAEGRFKRTVYGDPIAKIKLEMLRKRHLKGWRDRLEGRPARVSLRKGGEATERPRAPASINREMTVLRAALRTRLPPGPPGTEAAWQEALTAIKNASRRRTLYLDRSERQRLLDAIDAEAKPFVRALCNLPVRPGALAALTVADFDRRTSELTIGKDKSGKDRRVKVPTTTARLLEEQRTDKLPTALLFPRFGGKPWTRDSWKFPIAAAARAAGLHPNVTAYTLRHSTITDLVAGGVPALTVAQLSGTSVVMIEQHYAHLTSEASQAALEKLAL
jgi:integrase